jgi:hypothetical protein
MASIIPGSNHIQTLSKEIMIDLARQKDVCPLTKAYSDE